MPLIVALSLKFSPLTQADWTILQSAHNEASRILGRSARKHKDADRLAREVFRLFNQGHRDPNIIAAIAAQFETRLALESTTRIQIEARPIPISDEHTGRAP